MFPFAQKKRKENNKKLPKLFFQTIFGNVVQFGCERKTTNQPTNQMQQSDVVSETNDKQTLSDTGHKNLFECKKNENEMQPTA